MDNYIVGIGEVLWDCLPQGREIGGAPANFAYHTAQFGLEAMAVSAVGNDQLGKDIKDVFTGKGLKHLLETVDFSTGKVLVKVDASGIPTYEIKENVAWDNIPYSVELDAEARRCNVVCFGTLAQRSPKSRQTIRRFIDAMPSDRECYKIFDINLRQHYYDKNMIVESLQMCNVFKINDEELTVLKDILGYGNMPEREVSRRLLHDYELKYLILTCGTDGSFVFTKDAESYLDTPQVKVADTVGAGDSFTAAFIASILKGKTMEEAHKVAVEVSAYVCTKQGAMSLLPVDLII